MRPGTESRVIDLMDANSPGQAETLPRRIVHEGRVQVSNVTKTVTAVRFECVGIAPEPVLPCVEGVLQVVRHRGVAVGHHHLGHGYSAMKFATHTHTHTQRKADEASEAKIETSPRKINKNE